MGRVRGGVGTWDLIGTVGVGLVLLGACATTQGKPIAGGETTTVEAPTFKVGDEWRWEGGTYPTFVKVVAVQGDQSEVESNIDAWCQEGCRYVRDRNSLAISGTNRNGAPVYITGLKVLDFPLRVGKEWSQRLDLRAGATGAMLPYMNRWKVEAFEEISVKAGTFKAFRISWHQENLGPYTWWGNSTLWWSPDAKAFVKRVAGTTSSGGWGRDWELVSMTLK